MEAIFWAIILVVVLSWVWIIISHLTSKGRVKEWVNSPINRGRPNPDSLWEDADGNRYIVDDD